MDRDPPGFGAASAFAIQGLEENDTPWAGAFERINAYAYFAWLAVLALMVIRHELHGPRARRGSVEASSPVLSDEVVPEAVVPLLVGQRETGSLVDAPGRGEHVVRPQRDAAVSG